MAVKKTSSAKKKQASGKQTDRPCSVAEKNNREMRLMLKSCEESFRDRARQLGNYLLESNERSEFEIIENVKIEAMVLMIMSQRVVSAALKEAGLLTEVSERVYGG